MKYKAHPEVLVDIQSYLAVHNIKRMVYDNQEGYSITIGDEELKFPHEENAPPSGAIATNFSRHMHTEKNGSTFTTFWNLSCSHGPEAGANSFFASYGVRVCNASDSQVAFTSQNSHGTSLPSRSLGFTQTGPAFILGSRLAGQWKHYQADHAALSDIEKEMGSHSDSDLDIEME